MILTYIFTFLIPINSQEISINQSCICDFTNQCDQNCCCDNDCQTPSQICLNRFNSGYNIPLCSQINFLNQLQILKSGLSFIYGVIKRLLCIQIINAPRDLLYGKFQNLQNPQIWISQQQHIVPTQFIKRQKINVVNIKWCGKNIQVQYWRQPPRISCQNSYKNINNTQSIIINVSNISLNQYNFSDISNTIFTINWQFNQNQYPKSSTIGYTLMTPLLFINGSYMTDILLINDTFIVRFFNQNLRFAQDKINQTIKLATIPSANPSKQNDWLNLSLNNNIEAYIFQYVRIGSKYQRQYKIFNVSYNQSSNTQNIYFVFRQRKINPIIQKGRYPSVDVTLPKVIFIQKDVLYPFYVYQ